jgi:hypothetical protein
MKISPIGYFASIGSWFMNDFVGSNGSSLAWRSIEAAH